MRPERYFFFSYARENRKNADRERSDGSTFNLIDQFYERLCKCVSEVTGVPANDVGYRDVSALLLNSPWRQELVLGLQSTQTLVALISPHYLSSLNCGREFSVFMARMQLLNANTGALRVPTRIIPVFWVNSDQCWPHATPQAKKILEDYQLTGPGFPNEHPFLGLSRLREVGKPQAYDAFCLHLADRIRELAESEPFLPPLEAITDFRTLPSAFDPAQEEDKPVERVSGPVLNLNDLPRPAFVRNASPPPGLDLAP